MSLTSDQTAKIKSAVKTKLVEIGAYVDDQLSDYVMIMITNKKTEKQMTEDLELFLGGLEQAQNFSTWLHTLIKKTIDSGNEKSSTKTSSHHHHHHHSHKKSSNTPKSNRKGSTGSNGHISVQNNETDELAIQIDSNEFNEDFHDGEAKKRLSSNKPEMIVKEEKTVKKTETAEDTIKPQQQETTVNRFTKLVEQAAKSSTTISSTIGAIIKHEEPEKEDHTKKRLSSIVKVTDRKHSLNKSIQANKSILLKAVEDANTSVKSNLTKNKSIADERLEQMRSRRLGHGSDRAGRSSERNVKINEVFSSHYQHDRQSSIQNEKSTDEQRVKRLKKFAITFEQNSIQPGADKRVVTESENSKCDSRLIIKRSDDLLFSDKRSVKIESFEEPMTEEDADEKRMLSTSTDSESSNNNISINLNKEPIFTVNLDSLENNEFIKNLNKNKAFQKRTLSEMNDDNELDYDEEIIEDSYMENEEMVAEQDENGENIEIDEVEDVDRQKKKLIRCSYWPMCDKGDHCLYLHPNKPCTLFPKCTYGNLCHYLHPSCRYDGFCTRLDCTFTHVIKKPAQKEFKPTTEIENTEGAAATADTSANSMEQSNIFTKKNLPETASQTMSTTVTASNMSVVNTVDTASNSSAYKFSLNNNMTTVNNQIRMPRAAVPSKYFKTGSTPYQFGPNQYSQQYSFVNRATTPAININCKYGKMCQNPKCIYVHPNVQSQMKWTAALANTTNLNQTPASDQTEAKNPKENPIADVPKIQEPGVAVANNSMISQSS